MGCIAGIKPLRQKLKRALITRETAAFVPANTAHESQVFFSFSIFQPRFHGVLVLILSLLQT